jgi:hypothetical protein
MARDVPDRGLGDQKVINFLFYIDFNKTKNS